ncbi:MAG: PAS domain-containing protein, partial [Smithellaceae bacterium]|nr:PAS domain-containing protein [Smithellaceae bacterium]
MLKRCEFLIQNARDIILTIRQRDRKILEANTAALKAYQYSIDELRSLTIDQLESAESKEQVKLHAGPAGHHEMFFETTHVRKNGQTFPVEVSMQKALIGNEKILIGIVRDISRLNESQDAMQESESNIRALLNAVTESLLLLDKDGTILSANDTFAKRLRIGMDKIIGANYYDLLPADTANERRRQAQNVIQNRIPVRFEYVSDKRWIDQVIYPVFDSLGEVVRLAFFGADISR